MASDSSTDKSGLDPKGSAYPTRAPVIAPGHTIGSITEKISAIVQTRRTPLWWFVGLALSGLIVMLLLLSITVLLVEGTGVWGLNIPVAWGFAIINFVWWIGIGPVSYTHLTLPTKA